MIHLYNDMNALHRHSRKLNYNLHVLSFYREDGIYLMENKINRWLAIRYTYT